LIKGNENRKIKTQSFSKKDLPEFKNNSLEKLPSKTPSNDFNEKDLERSMKSTKGKSYKVNLLNKY